jgi:hypothetical protein
LFVARAHPATYVSLAIPDTRTGGATRRRGREVCGNRELRRRTTLQERSCAASERDVHKIMSRQQARLRSLSDGGEWTHSSSGEGYRFL